MVKKVVLMRKLVLIVLWSALIFGVCNMYLNARKNLVASVTIALEDAVQKDFQNRNDTELKFSTGMLGRKLKEISIVTEDGEENFEFKDSIDEAVAHRLSVQYLLAKIHPIHPDTLNHLLQEELKKYVKESTTGVVYTNQGVSQYSANDSLSIHRPFVHLAKPRVLDIKNTVRVQPWISTAPWYVVRNMHDGAFWSLLAFFFVLLWVSLSSWEEDDPNKVKFGKMILNKEAKKVTIHGKECKLRNQEFLLLLLFVEKPNHTLSRNEIRCAFWKDEQGTVNRVSNLLSTLRNALKDFPECQIIANEEDGYELAWTDTNEEDVKSKNTGTSLGLVDNQ